MPEAPRFAMYSGCVLDQISWQLQRSGPLTATAKLVAQGETVADHHRRRHARAAGAEALRAFQRQHHPQRHGARQRGLGRDHLRQQPRPHRDHPQRRPASTAPIPSIAALTGRVEVRFADQVLVNQAIAGDPCELEFGYALPSGESFTFTVHAVYLPRPRIEIAGPQGVQATFDWQAARDTGVGRMCTAFLVNDVEEY